MARMRFCSSIQEISSSSSSSVIISVLNGDNVGAVFYELHSEGGGIINSKNRRFLEIPLAAMRGGRSAL